MELKKVFIAAMIMLAFMSSCTDGGTEVTNPSDDITLLTFVSKDYGFSLSLPEGWTYTEYIDGRQAPADIYHDPAGTASVVALFQKGESSFVALFDKLDQGQSLAEYVSLRNPNEKPEYHSDEQGEIALINSETRGEHDGSIIIIYAAVDGNVLCVRFELVVNSAEEAKTMENDLNTIFNSIVV